MRKLSPTTVFLFIEFTASALFGMMFVATSLYEITVAGLTPLQLVLVGTTLEFSAFAFEVPTGVVADVYSRRLSIILGYVLLGAGFMVEGSFPAFLPIVFAQVIKGLGYTFISGATQAWISDEVGEATANQLFLRATRVGLFASLLGMGAALLIGSTNVAVPIRTGALGLLLIGLTLTLIMPETGFHPTPREDRNDWQHMWHTFRQGLAVMRGRPQLMSIVGVGLFYGLYSEGFDRLWVKHLLDTFSLPVLFGSNQLAFFALLRAAGTALTILAVHFVERRVDTSSPLAIGRAMLIVTAMISLALFGFATASLLVVALALYLAIDVLRDVAGPLQSAWVNQKLDSRVRATVHSMFGQVDAIGQVAGGPVVGLVARFYSVVAALISSALLLAPALFLVGRANSQSEGEASFEAEK